ncbi:hypothetical protein DXG01_009803, partial [Tephrocybe rancida]
MARSSSDEEVQPLPPLRISNLARSMKRKKASSSSSRPPAVSKRHKPSTSSLTGRTKAKDTIEALILSTKQSSSERSSGSTNLKDAKDETLRGLRQSSGKCGGNKSEVKEVEKRKGKAKEEVFVIGTVVMLPYGVSASTPKAKNDSSASDSEDSNNLELQIPLKHDVFPSKLMMQTMKTRGLAVINFNNGISFAKSSTAEEFNDQLRTHLPALYQYLDRLPPQPNLDMQSNEPWLLPWLLCTKDKKKIAVVPGLPFPTGAEIQQFSHGGRTYKLAAKEWVTILTTQEPIPHHILEQIYAEHNNLPIPDVHTDSDDREIMEGDIGVKMNIDNNEGYTTSGYALLQGEMLASLSINSKKRKAEPSKKRLLVIVDSDLEEDDEKEQETDTFSGGYQTQTHPAKKAKVAKPRFYATR